MKFAFLGILVIALSSCNTFKKNKAEPSQSASVQEIMSKIEKNLFMSCPISKGPSQVISYLDGVPSFDRNKDYDSGNGSVRFNAKNASFFDAELIDDKSLFLLNYTTSTDDYKFFLFQAIYFFKNEDDKNYHFDKILDLLKDDLTLQYSTKYDAAQNPYYRFYLPDGSAFNLKHTPGNSDKHIIDILWVPDGN